MPDRVIRKQDNSTKQPEHVENAIYRRNKGETNLYLFEIHPLIDRFLIHDKGMREQELAERRRDRIYKEAYEKSIRLINESNERMDDEWREYRKKRCAQSSIERHAEITARALGI